MANYWENDEFLRDLQSAAGHRRGTLEDQADTADTPLSGSRAAMLSLIDRLARQSLPMLSLLSISTMSVAGFYVLIIPAPGIDYFGRLACWLVLVLASLVFAAHRLHLFRQGFAYNGRPFTWRSHYTATLSVLSSAFGSGAIFLTPDSVSTLIALLICSAIVITALILGGGHLAHRAAALTASMPALIIAHIAALFHIVPQPAPALQQLLFIWIASIAVTTTGVFWARARAQQMIAVALKDHPRNEMTQIVARHKRSNAGYNPFSIRLQQKKPSPDEPYRPSEL